MEESPHYPQHIQDLLNDLQVGKDPTETLLDYVRFLSADNTLFLLYNRLGYTPEKNSFAKALTRRQISSEIKQRFSDATRHSALKAEILYPAPVPSPPDRSHSGNKGLKALSLKVKEIICRKGYVSYKKVADELISELRLGELPDCEREEKNVLRRVYDALNVLIAVGAVAKDNKKYCWNGVPVDSLNDRSELVAHRRNGNAAKRENLRKIASKFFGLKELIRRNEQDPQGTDMIQFPLIVIATEETPKNNIKIEFNKTRTHVRVKLSREIKIVEDTELLIKLDLHRRCNEVPPELLKILNCPAFNQILFR